MGKAKYTDKYVTWQGEMYSYQEAADMLDITVDAFAKRVANWTLHEAMTIKKGHYREKRKGLNGQRPQPVFDGLTPFDVLTMRWVNE